MKKGKLFILSSIVLLTTFSVVGCSNNIPNKNKNVRIEISDYPSSLKVGEQYQLVANVFNAEDTSVDWEVKGEAASVDEEGVLTALTVGSSTIYAISIEDDTKNASFQINVIKANISDDPDDPTLPDETVHGYKLVWQDLFEGDTLNEEYWSYQIGNGGAYGIPGWGNSEQQYYKKENLEVSDGMLKITAKKESMGGQKYTSARIRTANKISFTYGRVEARMKLPAKTGLWPAFWLLPETPSPYGNWPNSGEIDIMEGKGRLPLETSGAIHYADSGNNHKYDTATAYFLGNVTEKENEGIDTFHTYAFERDNNEYRWYVDDYNFMSLSSLISHEGTNGQPFDNSFHILFNVAVGGHFDGFRLPNDSDLPATMEVDFVKWYQK